MPVWAKMTPNVTHIEDPTRAALRAGCHGISAINTIRSVIGVILDTLRPEPTVEGYTTPGGYSCKAVMPIALRMCMEVAKVIRDDFPGRTLRGIGGIESGKDAAQFILLGCDTVQVCTDVMKFGYRMRTCDDRRAGVVHGSPRLQDAGRLQGAQSAVFHHAFRPGASSGSLREAARAGHDGQTARDGTVVRDDQQWSGEEFVRQSDAPAVGSEHAKSLRRVNDFASQAGQPLRPPSSEQRGVVDDPCCRPAAVVAAYDVENIVSNCWQCEPYGFCEVTWSAMVRSATPAWQK